MLEKHGFYRAMDISNRTVAKTSELKVDTGKDDLYVYRVLCQEVGETMVTLEVGNKPKQAKNAVSLSVACGGILAVVRS